jgi:hypothetical protein
MTRAIVKKIDGRLVLDDPDAVAVAKAVALHNCRTSFDLQRERIRHFARRARELGREDSLAIVLLNVDDPNGGPLADVLMPNQDAMWQALRDDGQVPFARGLAERMGIEKLVLALDKEAGETMKAIHRLPSQGLPVVVMDQGVVLVLASDCAKEETL